MKKILGSVVSVHAGDNEDMTKEARDHVTVELDGFEGDKHRGFTRIAASWDPEPTGTPRRNERQWSGVSAEDLETIRERMKLAEPLVATTVGANICISGVPYFSQLPKGTKLRFPSGAVLMIEEENPPCGDMGESIESRHTSVGGQPVKGKLFPKLALGLRGVVGYVDLAGRIEPGDEVVVEPYEDPAS